MPGTVALTATVDSEATEDEADETNNTATATLVFHSVPALDLVIVPIRYTDLSNGQTYAPPTVDTISDFIERTYPLSTIHVTFHAPYNFTGDLGDSTGYDWGNNASTGLLDRVTTLKDSEVGMNSPKVYYGLVSTGTSVGDTWLPIPSAVL